MGAATQPRRDTNGRFQKGHSPNPGGRPKTDRVLAARFEEYLAEEDPDTKETKLERLLAALFKEAENGNVMAAREILDRAFGKPRQAVDLGGDLPATFAALAQQVWKEQRNGHGDGDGS